jgi:hypothetical protein
VVQQLLTIALLPASTLDHRGVAPDRWLEVWLSKQTTCVQADIIIAEFIARGFCLIEAPAPRRHPWASRRYSSRLLSGTRYPPSSPSQSVPSILAVARADPGLISNAASALLRCGLGSPPVLIPPPSHLRNRGPRERALIPPRTALKSHNSRIYSVLEDIHQQTGPAVNWLKHPTSPKISYCFQVPQARANSFSSVLFDHSHCQTDDHGR